MAISEDPDEIVPDNVEQAARAQLQVLDALLNVDGDAAAYAALFRALRALFDFDDALVLREAEAALTCIASEPEKHTSRQWPATALLREISHGRVLAIGDAGPGSAGEGLRPNWSTPTARPCCFPLRCVTS